MTYKYALNRLLLHRHGSDAIKVVVLAVATLGSARATEPPIVQDMMPLPPLTREQVSENERWHAEVIRPEELRPNLFSFIAIRPTRPSDGQNRRCQLAYPIGPRFFFVLDNGRVLLVDEWLRRFDTENALIVLSPDCETLARFSVDEFMRVSGQTEEAVKANAGFGPWLSGRPRLATGGEALILPIGHARVQIDLNTLRAREVSE